MRIIRQTAIVLVILIAQSAKSQSTVFFENFNNIPAGWTQLPAMTWSLNNSFGTGGGNCIIAENPSTNTTVASVISPTIDISSITNPTVSFKAGLVKNNFLCPNIVLRYTYGGGAPQFAARWGSGFTSPTAYTVFGTTDYTPPLDQQNVLYEACSHTIAATGNTLALTFDAEFVNGGWVLLDSIVVAGVSNTLTVGLQKPSNENPASIFPNPVSGKYAILRAEGAKEIFAVNHIGERVSIGFSKKSEGIFELDLSMVEDGIYFIGLSGDDGTSFRKIIVQ